MNKEKSGVKSMVGNIKGVMSDIFFLLRYLMRQSAFLTIFSLIVFSVVGLLPLVISFLYKILVDMISADVPQEVPLYRLIYVVIGYIIVTVALKLSEFLKSYVNLKLGLLMAHSFNLMYLDKFEEIDLAYLDDPKFFDIVTKSRADINQHPDKILFQIIDLFENLLSFVGYAVIMVSYSPMLLALCLISLLLVSLRYKEDKERQFAWKQEATMQRRRSEYFDNCQKQGEYLPEIRLFHLAPFLEEKYQQSRESLLQDELKLDLQSRVVNIVNNLIRESVSLGIQLYLACLVILSRITVGDFTLLEAAVSGTIRDGKYTTSSMIDTYILAKDISFLREFLSLGTERNVLSSTEETGSRQSYANIGKAGNRNSGGETASASEGMRSTVSMVSTENMISTKNTINMGRKVARNGGRHKFEFCHVSFQYKGASGNALTDLSFVIEPGEMVALVGENGGGKSTIMKLLLRLYEPDEGAIYMDGVNIKEYDREDYYAVAGAMFQNSINYSLSVEESVWLGNMEKCLEESGEKIDDALRFTDLYDDVSRLKLGKRTETSNRFTEEAFEPSGGELQKLSLARTWFRNSEYFILDEPSSALDAISERNIFQRFLKMRDGMTTLMITHRLSNMHLCDQILVLQDGVITEAGTHEELCQAQGGYFQMYKKQAKHYV